MSICIDPAPELKQEDKEEANEEDQYSSSDESSSSDDESSDETLDNQQPPPDAQRYEDSSEEEEHPVEEDYIPLGNLEVRIQQICNYYKLEKAKAAIDLLLNMKQEFALNGDFKTIETQKVEI